MERLFVECTVRALLLVGGTLILLYVMRVEDATAKFRVWAGVLALMLLLPFWVSWGQKINLRVLPALAPGFAPEVQIPINNLGSSIVHSQAISRFGLLLLSVYLLGLAVLLIRLGIGTVHTGRLIQSAILNEGVLTSSLCSAPITLGFFHPVVVFPMNWRAWPQAKLETILTHEREHARRHDSLVKWFALLNRAVFWFHPVAWWLERNLSALAEQACDEAVLMSGRDARGYAEFLMELARSVSRTGARLNIVGMTMPGGFLARRIHRIMEIGTVPRISRAWMACVGVACSITCIVVSAGMPVHAHPKVQASGAMNQAALQSSGQPATKFVLGDLKIDGDVHDRGKMRDTILEQWQGKEYDDAKGLAETVMGSGVRSYLQERGYFKVFAHDPETRLVGNSDGKQQVLVIVQVTEGKQYRLKNLIIASVPPDQALSIPATILREQFHLQPNDLFNVAEVRAGLVRATQLYADRGYPAAQLQPDTEIDEVAHQINLIIRVTEGVQKR